MKKKAQKLTIRSTSNYPVGDFLIRIKNAGMADRKQLSVTKSKFIKAVAQVLAKEGIIQDIKEDQENLTMRLVFKSKMPVLSHIRLVSKPGLRIYMGYEELEKIKGPSIFLVSTPNGIMTKKEAVKKHLGGEVLAEIL